MPDTRGASSFDRFARSMASGSFSRWIASIAAWSAGKSSGQGGFTLPSIFTLSCWDQV